jgi:uncharacterized protein (TIGR00297 family)
MYLAASPIPMRLAFGLVVSTLIGFVAYRRGSLSRSGIFGAMITGTTIFGFGGWAAGLTLIAFFVSSSLLSHFKERDTRKQHAAEMFDKGGQRDLWQALANGGAAALLAIVVAVTGPPLPSVVLLPAHIALAAMVGALATVTADTWATELGVLSKSQPRRITNFKTVERGTSGGISPAGIAAALAGAVFIALFFELLLQQEMQIAFQGVDFFATEPIQPLQGLVRFIAVVLGGVAGSLFDSFLGATVQAMYYSAARQKETEKQFERDGTPNKSIRGWRWLNNDWVNFISSLFGATVAAGIAYVLIR